MTFYAALNDIQGRSGLPRDARSWQSSVGSHQLAVISWQLAGPRVARSLQHSVLSFQLAGRENGGMEPNAKYPLRATAFLMTRRHQLVSSQSRMDSPGTSAQRVFFTVSRRMDPVLRSEPWLRRHQIWCAPPSMHAPQIFSPDCSTLRLLARWQEKQVVPHSCLQFQQDI